MKKTYEREEAQRLLPLLQAITREIRERVEELRLLDKRRRALKKDGHGFESEELAEINARMAMQKHEVRSARKELESLGCLHDPSQPDRILIPSHVGGLLSGFMWRIGSDAVEEAFSTV